MIRQQVGTTSGRASTPSPGPARAGTDKDDRVLQLQRMVGNRAVARLLSDPVVQRVPYATAVPPGPPQYSVSVTKTKLDQSEGRASPINNQEGHPRQHVGKWEKAERYADEQGRTKSVYVNTAAQDKAISSALSSAAGQQALGQLDANPAVPTRVAIENVDTDPSDVLVVKAKKKTGAPRGEVKSWQLKAGTASKATVIVDSRGTGTLGDIHIQTAYPVMD